MKPQFPVVFIVLVLAIGSCKQSNLVYEKPYFDFDSLIHTQVKSRSVQQKTIFKVAAINSQKDSSSFKADSALLAHEWDAFLQLDVINKPMYKNNYEISERADDKSNLTIRSYQAKIPSSVPYVHFYYHGSFANLKRIESKYVEKNVLNDIARLLTMTLDEEQGKPFIQKYSITGGQKMIFNDTVQFSIQGSISH
ncbi:MAG: hypothetical protein HOP30_01270 [Cyclobacteriaceae bacterium]|nr:hypothetical protein [Cyclobacteriaceae bacterium]